MTEVSREHENASEKEDVVTNIMVHLPRTPPLFPQILAKKTEEGKYCRFITILKQLSITALLIESLDKMPGYVKFMKYMKKEDPSAFTIPCTIGLLHFSKELCDLGGRINLMPLSMYKKLGLGDVKATTMRFFMVDFEVLVLARPFLATGRALVYIEKGKMKLGLNNEKMTFNICRSMKQSGEIQSVSATNFRSKSGSEAQIEERLGVEALTTVIMNFAIDFIEDYDEFVAAPDRCKY
ncbi:uncharacterized protein LOC107003754 [Solanum pennellii]|uniref:Uncharacterized protein LOC107003754 n=1 Tax=Solanum pennellii TaxID=28526 RepID=A0ABM1FIY5_SOLPN|nr:uncharacterized protein LOC107003754 [Solanum pennellii]